jgi:hypothetical protein
MGTRAWLLRSVEPLKLELRQLRCNPAHTKSARSPADRSCDGPAGTARMTACGRHNLSEPAVPGEFNGHRHHGPEIHFLHRNHFTRAVASATLQPGNSAVCTHFCPRHFNASSCGRSTRGHGLRSRAERPAGDLFVRKPLQDPPARTSKQTLAGPLRRGPTANLSSQPSSKSLLPRLKRKKDRTAARRPQAPSLPAATQRAVNTDLPRIGGRGATSGAKKEQTHNTQSHPTVHPHFLASWRLCVR